MARDTSIFAHGAVIVPDFVTPAEEARILLRIGEAPWTASYNDERTRSKASSGFTPRPRDSAGLPVQTVNRIAEERRLYPWSCSSGPSERKPLPTNAGRRRPAQTMP